jgi:hypothetical protein
MRISKFIGEHPKGIGSFIAPVLDGLALAAGATDELVRTP